MRASYFSDIEPIRFEGESSENALAYRYYDKDRMVLGKRMEDQLRFAVCYWHSFCWNGFDVFGDPTFQRPWHATGINDQAAAEHKLDEAFDFFMRLGLPYFCFHDVDVMARAETACEHSRNLSAIVDRIEQKMAETGVGLLWGTANLFSHRRYMGGAATNPDPDVFSFAAMQVHAALNATHRLGGANYVLWGGREGYDTILNTNLKQEKAQLGRFLNLVVEEKHKIGFAGTILIEPKPHEPTKHQYDFDVETIYGFLKANGLESEVKVNIEANHATLSGHSFEHEIAMAADLGILGSIDMNRGDPQNGWDTDQFPNDLRELTMALYFIQNAGGLGTGGLNFDSKVRRQSIDPVDLFHGHVGAVDLIARALLAAERLITEGEISQLLDRRYAGWSSPAAQAMLLGTESLRQISSRVLDADLAPAPRSGKQELLENVISRAFLE